MCKESLDISRSFMSLDSVFEQHFLSRCKHAYCSCFMLLVKRIILVNFGDD